LAAGHNSGDDGGQVVVWQLPETGEEPSIALQFEHNTGWVAGVRFSPDDTVLSAPGLNRVSLHNAQTGTTIINLFQPAGANDTAFSPDGRMVAISGNDGYVHIMAADLDELLRLARFRLTRQFTTDECQQYLHVEVCPGEE
jgi:WD40 repeat protein